MIFRNPAGAPELACEECGCRWFDRMTGNCYECGTPVSAEAQAEYRTAIEDFRRAWAGGANAQSAPRSAPAATGLPDPGEPSRARTR
jgi:ribosomal protein L37E